VPVRSHGKIHFEFAFSYKGKSIPDADPTTQGVIGVDFGTQHTAVFGKAVGGQILKHSPNGGSHEKDILRLKRQLSRKQVSNNPHSFDSNGAYIKGTKITRSKRMILLKRKIKALEEQSSRCRLQESNLAGKRISRMGKVIIMEDCLMEGWSKVAGKGVRAGTPSTVKSSLIKHAQRAGNKVIEVNTRKIRATQYDPISGNYNKIPLDQRTVVVGGVKVDRDLKSAYVLSHVNNNEIDVVTARNEWQASCR
jgi:hypothetical protein